MLTTGLGSLPGTTAREAARIVAGEFDLPYLPELPARGPGADMIGRTLAAVRETTGEFGAETTPSGWRLAAGRSGAELGRAMRRGVSWLNEDLDALEEALAGYVGPLKVQLTGPWTLAAAVEGATGHRLLRDPGACADLAGALAETSREHVASVRRRVPGVSEVWLQLDEPGLPAVIAGRMPGASGRGFVRVPETPELVSLLGAVIAVQGVIPSLHCCARQVPLEILGKAGFQAVSLDLTIAGQEADDGLGQWWDAGRTVIAGIAPAIDVTLPREVAGPLAGLWSRLGFSVDHVGARTLLSPTCGLAGASAGYPQVVARLLREAAGQLAAGRS
ncbi:MAG: methionine synthase [Candidatus Nanopelagicales bacterium]